jgi:hypothetical protein
VSKVLDDAVTSDGETWDFQCPGVQGDPCHGVDGRAFRSTRWPTKKAATARGAQHLAEHKANLEPEAEAQLMQPMQEFIRDQGLVVNDDGSVSVEDI